MVEEFMRQMSATLVANVLTVWFFYSMWAYTKREQAGIENEPGSGRHLTTMALVLVAMLGGFFFWGFFDDWPILRGFAAN